MQAMTSCSKVPLGARLPRLLRGRMERLFGATLGAVRLVVSDAPGRLGARAFAVGNTVHVAPHVLRARAAMQRQVLGHEIAHVLQQRAGATRRWQGRSGDVPALEAEAERAGRRIAAGRAVQLRRRTKQLPLARIQRIKLSLKGTKDGDLDAAALLNIMDAALATKLATATGCVKVGKYFTITEGGHWLSVLGKLAMGTAIVPFGVYRNSALPCTLKVSDTGSEMPIYKFGGTTERIDFPAEAVAWVGGRVGKRDLNYLQIAEGFRRLNNAGHADENIAADLLLKMKAQAMATDYGANGNAFMEAMAALMFGVEASRFPSAFLSSLLLLDLIRNKKCYGRDGTKRFKLTTAFDSGKNFDFNCLYGGKFPCAVHEPGKGNASNRRALGELGNRGNDATVRNGNFARGDGVGMLLELNHRFIVPRREVTLLIHWLEARIGAAAIPYVRKSTLQTVLETRIDQACGNAAPPDLPYAPRKDSGMHSADIPGARTKLALNMTVYWLNYEAFDRKTKTKSMKQGKWVHTDSSCKLIGGREAGNLAIMQQSYGKSVDAMPQLDLMKNWTLKTAENLRQAQGMACPHCCSA